jgi:hypothetical protein
MAEVFGGVRIRRSEICVQTSHKYWRWQSVSTSCYLVGLLCAVLCSLCSRPPACHRLLCIVAWGHQCGCGTGGVGFEGPSATGATSDAQLAGKLTAV